MTPEQRPDGYNSPGQLVRSISLSVLFAFIGGSAIGKWVENPLLFIVLLLAVVVLVNRGQEWLCKRGWL